MSPRRRRAEAPPDDSGAPPAGDDPAPESWLKRKTLARLRERRTARAARTPPTLVSSPDEKNVESPPTD